MSQPPENRRYVRAIESAWSRLRARPTVLSPREFEIVDGWRRRGVPLGVVLEVLDHHGRRGSGKAPRSLAYLTPAIDEAWAAVAVGRAAVASPPASASSGPRAFWSGALERAPEGSPLRVLLTHLLERADAGDEPHVLDADLDAALAGAAPTDVRESCEAEASAALLPFRGRMTEEEFRKTCERARVDRLRAALGLPRLRLTR